MISLPQSHPRIHFKVFAAALACLLAVLGASPALAATSLSVSEVSADIDVTLTLRASTGTLDPTTSVTANFPADFTTLACGAPDGWSCQIGEGQASWSREGSIDPGDDTFSLAVHTPAEAGSATFMLTDTRTSGEASTSAAQITVVAPEPEQTEPVATETASEQPTPEPSRSASEPDAGDGNELAPFRAPTGEDAPPISINDLPSEDDPSAAAEPGDDRVIASSGRSAQSLLAALITLLLLTSVGGFLMARANR
ncbi:MAG: hypothetical protein ACI867_001242 [Glaciecola sp.]